MTQTNLKVKVFHAHGASQMGAGALLVGWGDLLKKKKQPPMPKELSVPSDNDWF